MDPKLIELLHHEVHPFSMAKEYRILLKKIRILVRYSKIDLWVNEALGQILKDKIHKTELPHVFSYIPGKGPLKAIRRIQSYIRKHIRDTPLKKRGLFVIQADIKEYTDQIPLGERSPLWPLLETSIQSPILVKNVKRSIRVPVISNDNPFPRSRWIGVPMGSHLTPWIANLYLKDFDAQIEKLDSEALYLRYGDDLFWCSPNRESAEQALEQIKGNLQSLGLELNLDKTEFHHWSGNGLHQGQWKGTPVLKYLGQELQWNNKIGITGEKRSLILTLLRSHLSHTRTHFKDYPPNTRRMVLTKIIEDFFQGDWRAHPRFKGQLNLIRDQKVLKSIQRDALRETARIEFGETRGYFIRKLLEK